MTGLLDPTTDQLRRAFGATLQLQQIMTAVIEGRIAPSTVQRVRQADASKVPGSPEWLATLIGEPMSVSALLDEVAE